MSIEAEKNKLFGILNIYSDCEHCGVVLSDPNLLKPDPYNPGRFKSLCPACKMETWRSPLVYSSLKEVFEMMAQCAEIGRPILVLTLACTAYEMMVDDFAYRLLEKENSSLDVCSFVVDSLELRGKIKLIESMTSKKIKGHAKDLGFDSLSTTYEMTKQKRNGFLHSGCSYRTVTEKFGKYPTEKRIGLNEEDSLQALKFAQELILFFADLFTKYGTRATYEEY